MASAFSFHVRPLLWVVGVGRVLESEMRFGSIGNENKRFLLLEKFLHDGW